MLRGIKIAAVLAAITLVGCANRAPIYAENNPKQNAKITNVAVAFQRGPIKLIYYASPYRALEPQRMESEKVTDAYMRVVETIATRQLSQELGRRGIYGGPNNTRITIRPIGFNVPGTEMKLELTVETRDRPKWAATLTATYWYSKANPVTDEGFAKIVTDGIIAELVKAGFIDA